MRSFKCEEEKEVLSLISLAVLPVYFYFVNVVALTCTHALFATV